MNSNRAMVIGVPISAVNMEIVVDNIFEDLEATRGQYICVSNAHSTVLAHDDPDYYRVQAESFMSVPDGKPLSLVGKKQFPEMDRVTGADLMRRIFTESKDRDLRHFFYGDKQEVLDAMKSELLQDYPWLNIVGMEPSVFRDMTEQEEEELKDRINSTNPDFLWVALGAPRQENYCFRMKGRIHALMIGVGGAFNVMAGTVSEAPVWMENLCLEWFYRFIQEPRRLFKRYFIYNSKFLWYQWTKKAVRTEKKEKGKIGV